MGNVHNPDTWTGSPLGPMLFIEHIKTGGNNLFIANERFSIDRDLQVKVLQRGQDDCQKNWQGT